jgi:hypothetical protein
LGCGDWNNPALAAAFGEADHYLQVRDVAGRSKHECEPEFVEAVKAG